MIRKILLSLCFVACLSVQSGFCSETTYTITESELIRLEQIFLELQANNDASLTELSRSKANLTIAQNDLKKYRQDLEAQQEILRALKKELTVVRKELETAQHELTKANESLQTYAQEVKRNEQRLKTQRSIWITVATIIALKK